MALLGRSNDCSRFPIPISLSVSSFRLTQKLAGTPLSKAPPRQRTRGPPTRTPTAAGAGENSEMIYVEQAVRHVHGTNFPGGRGAGGEGGRSSDL